MDHKRNAQRLLQSRHFGLTKKLLVLGWMSVFSAAAGGNCGATEIAFGIDSIIDVFGRSAHHRDIKIYVSPNGDMHAVDFQPGIITPQSVLVARKDSGSSNWVQSFSAGPLQGDIHLRLVPGTQGANIWLSVAKAGGGGDLYLSTDSGKSYKKKGEIKAPPGAIHEAQVFCRATNDCLAVINGSSLTETRTYYSHWNGLAWCDGVNPLYDGSLNPFVLHTVIPTGSPNNYDVIRLDQVAGFTDINQPHHLVYSNHTIQHRVSGECKNNPITLMAEPTDGQPLVQVDILSPALEPPYDYLLSDLVSLSMAKDFQGNFWVLWSYFNDPENLNDVNIRLRHWKRSAAMFDAEESIGDDSENVAYNFANLDYDEGRGKFYLFYQAMRKNGCNGNSKDCEDFCYRTVDRGKLAWSDEICPVRNVIMKQPEDLRDYAAPDPHGDNNFTGSVANGKIAMIYQDGCVNGTCSVHVWRGTNP